MLDDLTKKSFYRVRDCGNLVTITQYQKSIEYNKKVLDTDTGEILSHSEFCIEREYDQSVDDLKLNDTYQRVSSNFNTKRDNFIDLVNSNIDGKTMFLTFTYDSKHARFFDDFDGCKKDWDSFGKRLKRYLGYNPQYVAVPELQKTNNRQAWHIHSLFFGLDRFPAKTLRSLWGNGAVNIKKVDVMTSGLGKYLSKYLLKDINDLTNGKKSYWSSHNLKRPSLYYDPMPFSNTDFDIEREEEYDSKVFGHCKKIIYKKRDLI